MSIKIAQKSAKGGKKCACRPKQPSAGLLVQLQFQQEAVALPFFSSFEHKGGKTCFFAFFLSFFALFSVFLVFLASKDAKKHVLISILTINH